MTEEEYLRATNMAKLNVARTILGTVVFDYLTPLNQAGLRKVIQDIDLIAHMERVKIEPSSDAGG